jgi:hypothetical protein
MAKVSFAGGRAYTDFAQRLGVPQLTKEHGDELAPATETEGAPFGLVLAHGRFNSKRGINCRICEKILLTRVKAAEPP